MIRPGFLLSVLMVLALNKVSGQSDQCIGSPMLVCGSAVNGNTSAATADVAPFCGTGDGTGGGVWYRITGNGQNITASLCNSGYDTRIRVFTGTCGNLACVTGNDDQCGTRSRVSWPSTNGTLYHILVHGFGANTGAFYLAITCAPIPPPLCYTTTATSYVADPFAGTALALGDDVHSPVVPIGFPFCYNGTTYTNCVISSNNYISFNTAMAGLFSPWSTVAVPTLLQTAVHNTVMAPWQDIHPGLGGQVRYQTLGTAPNRRFVVSYQNIPMYGCSTQVYTSQTVLYEGTNCIGTFITDKPVCTSHNNGHAVHALLNANGASGHAVASRNNTQWTSTMQGLYFTPTCAPCSTATTSMCLPAVLPVELLRFDGRTEGSNVLLEWATASEQDSRHFVVERSDDLETFMPIGMVEAAGNSQAELHYTMLDERPAPGINYYRLRSVDLDGTFDLSEVVPVQVALDMRPLIYPNPAQELVHVRLPDGQWEETTIVVRDLSGRVVRAVVMEGRVTRLTLAGFRPGAYILEVPSLGPSASSTFKVL